MDVELPTIMHRAGGSQTVEIECWTPGTNGVQFYAWSPAVGVDRYRSTWILVGDKLYETNNTQTIRNSTLQSWECLDSIPYKPELKVWFPIVSIIIFYLIVRLIFRLLRGKGL